MFHSKEQSGLSEFTSGPETSWVIYRLVHGPHVLTRQCISGPIEKEKTVKKRKCCTCIHIATLRFIVLLTDGNSSALDYDPHTVETSLLSLRQPIVLCTNRYMQMQCYILLSLLEIQNGA